MTKKYVMERTFVRDKHGNLVYPPPRYVECNGQQVEISEIPLYFYMPKEVDVEDEDDGRVR